MNFNPRIDNSDITSAGNFLERELLVQLPKVYERKYAKLWLSGANEYVPFVGGLEGWEQEIEEVTLETAGLAKEYVDKSSDIPIASSSITTRKFNIHAFSIATEYSIRELLARQQSGRNIDVRELQNVNTALMRASHELAVFGNVNRGSAGLFNDSRVPNSSSSYNPNTATWQDHVDFFSQKISDIEDRNNLTEGIRYILIPNKLKHILATTYQTGDSGKNAMEAIMSVYGTQAGGMLEGFIAKNECRADLLEQFGVRPAGTNEDRIVFLPANPDVASRMGGVPFFLPTERERASFINLHMVVVSQTMIHYPDAMEYVDVPQVI